MPIQQTPFTHFKKYEGVGRMLKFDMNALSDFEQETGMGFGQLMSQKAIFAAVRGLLWAGFRHQDRRISIERVGDLMQQYIEDPDAPENEISDLLAVVFQAAQDQGAFGRAKETDFTQQLRLAEAKVVDREARQITPDFSSDTNQGQ